MPVPGTAQFALGDMASEIEPMRSVGGSMPNGTDDLVTVAESLQLFADDIGVERRTVEDWRYTANRWPKERRKEGVFTETLSLVIATQHNRTPPEPLGVRVLQERPGAYDRERGPGRRGWRVRRRPGHAVRAGRGRCTEQVVPRDLGARQADDHQGPSRRQMTAETGERLDEGQMVDRGDASDDVVGARRELGYCVRDGKRHGKRSRSQLPPLPSSWLRNGASGLRVRHDFPPCCS